MNLLDRIKKMLEFDDVSVAETLTETPTGKKLRKFAVNKRGVVFQFNLPAEETDEGVIEDFLEFIDATISELD